LELVLFIDVLQLLVELLLDVLILLLLLSGLLLSSHKQQFQLQLLSFLPLMLLDPQLQLVKTSFFLILPFPQSRKQLLCCFFDLLPFKGEGVVGQLLLIVVLDFLEEKPLLVQMESNRLVCKVCHFLIVRHL